MTLFHDAYVNNISGACVLDRVRRRRPSRSLVRVEHEDVVSAVDVGGFKGVRPRMAWLSNVYHGGPNVVLGDTLAAGSREPARVAVAAVCGAASSYRSAPTLSWPR